MCNGISYFVQLYILFNTFEVFFILILFCTNFIHKDFHIFHCYNFFHFLRYIEKLLCFVYITSQFSNFFYFTILIISLHVLSRVSSAPNRHPGWSCIHLQYLIFNRTLFILLTQSENWYFYLKDCSLECV